MVKRPTHVVGLVALLLAATTRPALPKLEYYSGGMLGSWEVTVTPDGLLTQTVWTRERGERSGTRQLTTKQMAELVDVAAACLRRPDALQRATDIRVKHQIGDQSFDDDGTNSRFDQLNATLSRLAKPVKLRAVSATR